MKSNRQYKHLQLIEYLCWTARAQSVVKLTFFFYYRFKLYFNVFYFNLYYMSIEQTAPIDW